MSQHPLRQYRERAGLSQPELAQKIGVNPHTVYRWEAGLRAPRNREIRRISEVTGIPAAKLAAAGVEFARPPAKTRSRRTPASKRRKVA